MRKRSTSSRYKALMCVFGQKATKRTQGARCGLAWVHVRVRVGLGVEIKHLPMPMPVPSCRTKAWGSSSIALNKWMNSAFTFFYFARPRNRKRCLRLRACPGKTHVEGKANFHAAHIKAGACKTSCKCHINKGIGSESGWGNGWGSLGAATLRMINVLS